MDKIYAACSICAKPFVVVGNERVWGVGVNETNQRDDRNI